jgi:hypothetical protein
MNGTMLYQFLYKILFLDTITRAEGKKNFNIAEKVQSQFKNRIIEASITNPRDTQSVGEGGPVCGRNGKAGCASSIRSVFESERLNYRDGMGW